MPSRLKFPEEWLLSLYRENAKKSLINKYLARNDNNNWLKGFLLAFV
jgi:hypothetical protein